MQIEMMNEVQSLDRPLASARAGVSLNTSLKERGRAGAEAGGESTSGASAAPWIVGCLLVMSNHQQTRY